MALQGRGLFCGSGNPFGGIAFFQDADLSRVNKIHGLHITEPDTLGVTVTQIALEDLFFFGIKTHGTKGACTDTGTAADADIVVDKYPPQFLIA
jgi:hypothetical protein